MTHLKTGEAPAVTSRDKTEGSEAASFEALAASQGVSPVKDFEDLLGGWPAEEIDDGFEEAVAAWRRQERNASTRS